jgi:hypothetical protein
VVVDTGATVKHVCIRFSADSISGREALDLANQVDPSLQPLYRDYGGLGAAVCSLCGTGNPQSDCLGQQSGKYWAYNRAPSGTTKFAPSSIGLSSTQVRDGDVEGWHWGAGGSPPYASVDQVCGTLTTDGTFTPTSVSHSGEPPQSSAGSPAAVIPQPRTASVAAQPTPVPLSTTTSTALGASAPTSQTEPTPASSPSGTALAQMPQHRGDSAGGGSWAGLMGFAAIGTGLGAWFWWLRHSRGRARE